MIATVDTAQRRLETLIEQGASAQQIENAQAALEDAQATAKTAERRSRERQALTAQIAGRKVAEEQARRRQMATDAERTLRGSVAAPLITVEYLGIRMVFRPEMSGDGVVRTSATHALNETLQAIAWHFREHVIATARAQALGKEAPRADVSVERLADQLADRCRAAIKHGTVDIQVRGEQERPS